MIVEGCTNKQLVTNAEERIELGKQTFRREYYKKRREKEKRGKRIINNKQFHSLTCAEEEKEK